MKDTPKAAQANKISVVKCKGDDPKFGQQQAPQSDGLKRQWKRSKRAGTKQKEKELKDSSSHAHMAQRRSGSTESVLAKSKWRRSRKTLSLMPTPILLWLPIPPVLSHPWILMPFPIAPPRCIKVNKVLPSIQGSRTPSLSPIGLSSPLPVKTSVDSILGFRSRGLDFYPPLSASHHLHTHPHCVLHPCCSHLHMTSLLSSTVLVFQPPITTLMLLTIVS